MSHANVRFLHPPFEPSCFPGHISGEGSVHSPPGARSGWSCGKNNTNRQRGFTVGASPPLCFLQEPALALFPRATRKVPEGKIGQGLKGSIRCGHLLNERLKSNDDFGCSLTVASDKIEQLSDF